MELVERLREEAGYQAMTYRKCTGELLTEAADLLEEALKALRELTEYVALNAHDEWLPDGLQKSDHLLGLTESARFILTKARGEKIDG